MKRRSIVSSSSPPPQITRYIAAYSSTTSTPSKTKKASQSESSTTSVAECLFLARIIFLAHILVALRSRKKQLQCYLLDQRKLCVLFLFSSRAGFTQFCFGFERRPKNRHFQQLILLRLYCMPQTMRFCSILKHQTNIYIYML